MSSSELQSFFSERYAEIDEYLQLLEEIDHATQSGAPRLVATGSEITASQQKILYSSVYLQLYNLVEATISRCIDAVADAAVSEPWKIADLNSNLRNEWIRSTARTHADQAADKRLTAVAAMCEQVIAQLPLSKFSIEKGGGGNWDDESIYEISKRIGCHLKISASVRRAVKQKFRDNLGALQLVKARRNDLAHGSVSFTECADGVVAADLRRLADAVQKYLDEVITCFTSHIELFEFLLPDRKPLKAP
ncbi:MAG: MAE_28990/MAE_18760 family HEPN-like nuclease [Actinophytocola sp.]|uniref:MAE_28990/MAE_18760 family HEPN-like nuclease n=1 Tax=Actinophytocola sp. TaxID=1872138 RepID=UPI003C71A4B3